MSESASRNVGTTLLFENDRVRVWDMTLQPGESSERHFHENDYVFVTLNDADLTLITEQGEAEQSHAAPCGVEYTEVGQGITHRLQNTGRTVHREILVELKGPSRSATAQEPETND